MVEPNKPAYITEIGTDLEYLQAAVKGHIELISYLHDPKAIMVGNDEAKLIGMKGNRHIDYGGVIAGPFFVCGDGGEDFRSLTDEEVERYMQKYAEPEEISDQEVADDTGFTFVSL